MLDVATILIANWLRQNIDGGLNDMIQSIPRKALNPADPDDPAPPIIPVCDDITDKGTAANLEPDEVPCLMFFADGTADDVDMKGYKIAKQVALCAAYVTAEDADPLSSARENGYILRGARLSLGRYNTAAGKPFRELNGIKVMEISKVREHRVTAAVGRRKLWGFLDIRAIVVETLQ